MTTPCCDECEGRIRSQIERRPVGGTYQLCTNCLQKIREENLTPGDDFEVGELWTTDDEDEREDADE